MLLSVSIGSVLVSLMENVPSSNDSSSDNNSISSKNNNSNDRNSNNTSENNRDPMLLETAFSVKLSGLSTSIDMRLVTAVNAKLHSISVLDCRKVSDNYVYKEMLSYSTLGSQYNSETYLGEAKGKINEKWKIVLS